MLRRRGGADVKRTDS